VLGARGWPPTTNTRTCPATTVCLGTSQAGYATAHDAAVMATAGNDLLLSLCSETKCHALINTCNITILYVLIFTRCEEKIFWTERSNNSQMLRVLNTIPMLARYQIFELPNTT
jgi:hypothetical protein